MSLEDPKNLPKNLYWCIYCKEAHEAVNFEVLYGQCVKGHYLVAPRGMTLAKYAENMRKCGHDIYNLKEFEPVPDDENNYGFPRVESEEDKMYVR